MIQVIGFETKHYHKITCPKCGAIIGFDNSDIYMDDFGCEIICPNCNNEINF